MFVLGIKNNSKKINAGKMRDNLINLYPGRFSIPGETQMKQFIGKLSQHKKNKQKKKSLTKSTRGMKAGNLKPS